jgi:hypothetical protein
MFCVCDTGGNAVTAYLLQQFKLHAPGGDPAARYIFPMTGIYSSDLFVRRDWDFDRPGTDRPGRRKVPLRNEHTAEQYGSPPQRLLFVPRFNPPLSLPTMCRPRAPGYFPRVLKFGLVGPRASASAAAKPPASFQHCPGICIRIAQACRFMTQNHTKVT